MQLPEGISSGIALPANLLSQLAADCVFRRRLYSEVHPIPTLNVALLIRQGFSVKIFSLLKGAYLQYFKSPVKGSIHQFIVTYFVIKFSLRLKHILLHYTKMINTPFFNH